MCTHLSSEGQQDRRRELTEERWEDTCTAVPVRLHHNTWPCHTPFLDFIKTTACVCVCSLLNQGECANQFVYTVSEYCRFSLSAHIRNQCLNQCIYVSKCFPAVTIFNTEKQLGWTVHSKVFGVRVITVAIVTTVRLATWVVVGKELL